MFQNVCLHITRIISYRVNATNLLKYHELTRRSRGPLSVTIDYQE